MSEVYSSSEQSRSHLLYQKATRPEELISKIKIIAFYLGVVIVWLTVASIYRGFGRSWIIPAVSVMWIAGAVTVFVARNDEENTTRETRWAILGFLGFLLIYRSILPFIVPLSSAQMAAALDINIPAVSGAAIAGMLQSVLLLASVLTPVGYLIWCGQKIRQYHGRRTRQAVFERTKGVKRASTPNS